VNVVIQRFKSVGFRTALSECLLDPSKSLPIAYVIKSATAVGADGRERQLSRRLVEGTMVFEAHFCEAEHLAGVRVDFADLTSEVVSLEFILPPGETLDFCLRIEF
jgi:hypothetical protein